MKVVLAEKPSVARDIASELQATTKRDGYYEGNGYCVTWAFGHLVTICEPEDMNPAWGKPWTLKQLPMLPPEWKYRIADKAEKQFGIIKTLFADATSIICATDAGREGEHIFRLIYQLVGINKPVQRLWISSLTAEAIRDGFQKLQPSKEFDNLAAAAIARAHADWLVGLNFTRAYTQINNQLCTIGRVQTPTLALIVERQNAIDNFKPTAFYEIIAMFEPGFKAHYITPGTDPQTRLQDSAAAAAILAAITPLPSGPVLSVITEEKKTKAPALYDLLSLQKEANKRYGYSAQETLDLAQNLYEEHKILSYPRTESRHLSTDMVDELPQILSALLNSPFTTQEMRDAFVLATITPGAITGDLLRPRLGKSYVDDTKLTDHHAIIPTHKTPPPNLPEKQSNVYQLVARRFLGIFLPPEVRDETTVIIGLADHSFRARGIVIKEPGWTVIEPQRADDDDQEKDQAPDSQQLPQLAQGQQLPKRGAQLKEGKTTPPKAYDDSSLLTAMKNAGNEIDDQDLAAYMKQSGLGTPATRAAIIERLVSTAYIERRKKALVPTPKGTALINQVHPDLKDIKLTAGWEQRLSDMQDGKLPLTTFENDIASFVARILPLAINGTTPIPATAASGLGPCPECKQGVVRPGPKSASCNRWKEGCKFAIWNEQHGKKLSESQITQLLEKRRTNVIKGFKKKDGSGTYDARLTLNDDFKVRLEFDNTSRQPARATK
jgi:DNA topoisomerase-3